MAQIRPLKISLIGEQNTGKTTISNALRKKPIDPRKRKPTIGVDVNRIDLQRRAAALWDLGGQRRFRFMHDMFTKGTDLAIVVTDSSQDNVEDTRTIVEKFQRTHSAKLIAFANKQDMPDALDPLEIQQRLGVKTYGTIAIDGEDHQRLFEILEYETHELKA